MNSILELALAIALGIILVPVLLGLAFLVLRTVLGGITTFLVELPRILLGLLYLALAAIPFAAIYYLWGRDVADIAGQWLFLAMLALFFLYQVREFRRSLREDNDNG